MALVFCCKSFAVLETLRVFSLSLPLGVAWWSLISMSGGDAASGLTERTRCPTCEPEVVEADCVVDYDSKTVACSVVNTSSCDLYSQCAFRSRCVMIFHPSLDKWKFSTSCFRGIERNATEHCDLENVDRAGVSFPPTGVICFCRNCSLDQTFLYVHQEPTIDPNVTSSFSLLTGPRTGPSSFPPSPTNIIENGQYVNEVHFWHCDICQCVLIQILDDGSDGSHSSSLHTSYIAAIVCLILLVLVLTIAAIAIYICLQRKKNSFTHNVEEF